MVITKFNSLYKFGVYAIWLPMDIFPKEILLVSGITSILIITLFLLVIATGIIMLVLVYQKKQVQYISEKRQLEISFEKEILESQIEIQEQTLLHISRELHDNFGHIASLIKINLNTLKLEDTQKATLKIEETKDLTRLLISDIKTLSVSLNSDRIAKTGLAKALQTEVERLNKTDLFIASFVQNGNVPEIENDKAIILYRMAQEVLNNMVKHSAANCINVNLNSKDNLFILAFSDDGKGFDVEKQLKNGGSGLTNLQKRAGLINAQLTIQSKPGSGTHIVIEMCL
jgi:signal transduction histidine kinase